MIFNPEPGSDPVMPAPNLLAGQWRTEGAYAERLGPYTRRTVTRARQSTPEEVEEALGYARASARTIAALAPAHRAAVLEKAAVLAAARRTELARALALELGKPVKDGGAEIDRVCDTLAVCAAEARRLGGEVLPVAGWERGVGNTALTYRAPAGVALAITPFNAPANLLAHKLGAAFAAGDTTIVKSPPQAPGTTTLLVRLLLDAGMPVEAVQLLHGGAETGAALAGDPRVDVVSFTGSSAAGAAVARAAGPRRTVLELGGNAATIVCEDADVEHAAAVCARTGYSNSGQSCISVQRVYVRRERFEEFLGALAKQVAALRVGDPLDPATDVGAMVDEDAAERVVAWSAEARAAGARILAGGTREGATAAPTIVADPSPDAKVVTEEVFGALVAVLPFDAFEDAVAACNTSRFGLQAGLFTNDLTRVFTAWRDLEVGGLIVNGSSNYRLDHVPFGGVKDSGIGRESPRWMIEDYTVTKTLILRDLSIWGTRR